MDSKQDSTMSAKHETVLGNDNTVSFGSLKYSQNILKVFMLKKLMYLHIMIPTGYFL